MRGCWSFSHRLSSLHVQNQPSFHYYSSVSSQMPIPTYEECMLPLLKQLADGQPHRMKDIIRGVADAVALTPEDQAATLSSGQLVIANRVGWARTYLTKAGLISSPQRGVHVITDAGRAVLKENPASIGGKYLEQFAPFREFISKKPKAAEPIEPLVETPEEIMQAAHEQLQAEITSRLLDVLKDCEPYFFEQVVLRLLQAMGYGIAGSGEVTPRSHDGGIDGIIHEDKLGLDTVCIQAKRWDGTVGRRIVQEFVGSMDLYRSRKGVILTTGTFSADALNFVDRIEGKKVVLIDGEQLCGFMMDHKIGVTVRQTYEILDVSQDFFDAEGS
jgi:restriction system protein